jgi:hypothetical protein
MSVFRADPDTLAALADAVGRSLDELAPPADAGHAVLTSFGYPGAAVETTAALAAATEWAEAWIGSLHTRAALLHDPSVIPVGSQPIDVAIGPAAFAVFQATPGSSGNQPPVGRGLATHLLDALEQQQLDEVEAILLQLQALDDRELVAFFERLGVDMVGIFPQLVVDAGVNPVDLAPYLSPMGEALGTASRAGDGMALSFTGAEMMDGHEGRSITPAAYFDFGVFSSDFVFAAAGKVFAGFAESDLPLHGADYVLEDGSGAGPDPRLPLIRTILAADLATQRGFLTHLAVQGDLAGLVAPATQWSDGGEGVGALLRSLVTGIDAATVDTTVGLIRVVADAGGLAPAIALGSAVAVAPHLPSFVLATRFGAGAVTLEQTEVRSALEAVPDAPGVVTGFLAALLPHPEARATLHTAFSALLAATVAERLDPANTDSLAPLADDFAVLWGALFGLSLQSDLDEARGDDAAVGMAGDAANVAVGYMLTGGAGAIAATGFRAWAANALGGAGLVAAPVEALLGGTGDAEQVLLESFNTIDDAATAAAAVLAAELRRRGVVELPPALLDEAGHVHLEYSTDWSLLADAFADAGIDPTVWFNDIMAIFAYGIPQPQ